MAQGHTRSEPSDLPPADSDLGRALRNLQPASQDTTAGDDVHYLWPDNVIAWRCWLGVQTQWRVGVAGATGLDYTAVLAFLTEEQRQRRLRRRDYADVWAGIRAAESAVLAVWGEQRKSRASKG